MTTLTVYKVYSQADMAIVPAYRDRSWMADTDDQFARRCLPLLMANQSGWFILNNLDLTITWNGGNDRSDLIVEHDAKNAPAASLFGYGIITWRIPYLFRTTAGYNLLVRGPSNWPVDGVCPLEGLVETDWAVAPFTMNWKVTRPNVPIKFSKGMPVCMIVVQRRHDLEGVSLESKRMEEDDKLYRNYLTWTKKRKTFFDGLRNGDEAALKQKWLKDYFFGRLPNGENFADHQTKLELNHLNPEGEEL